jgi:hypothetical protein
MGRIAQNLRHGVFVSGGLLAGKPYLASGVYLARNREGLSVNQRLRIRLSPSRRPVRGRARRNRGLTRGRALGRRRRGACKAFHFHFHWTNFDLAKKSEL